MLDRDDNRILKLLYDEILDAKAEDIVFLDVSDISTITEYFVICTGAVSVHIERIYNGIKTKMSEIGLKPFHFDDSGNSGWMALDYGFIFIHIFSPKMRSYYDLDSLWADGKKISF